MLEMETISGNKKDAIIHKSPQELTRSMKLYEIKAAIKGEVLWGNHLLTREVKIILGCSLMSDALTVTNDPFLLLTPLTSVHVIHIAKIMDAVGIVFVEGKQPGEEIIKTAAELEVPLLATCFSITECRDLLCAAGLKGCLARS